MGSTPMKTLDAFLLFWIQLHMDPAILFFYGDTHIGPTYLDFSFDVFLLF